MIKVVVPEITQITYRLIGVPVAKITEYYSYQDMRCYEPDSLHDSNNFQSLVFLSRRRPGATAASLSDQAKQRSRT